MEWAIELTVTLDTGAQAPVAPAKLEGTAAPYSVALTWEAPAAASDELPVLEYSVSFRLVGANRWTIFGRRFVEPRGEVTGLAADEEYEFQVRAWNAIGRGAAASVEVRTAAQPSATDTEAAHFVALWTGDLDIQHPDPSSITLQVPVDAVVLDAWVTFSLAHNMPSDLELLLRHGDHVVRLLYRPGRLASEGLYCRDGAYEEVTLRDHPHDATKASEALPSVQDVCSRTVTGTYRAAGELGAFRGMSALGAWDVVAADLHAGEHGSLHLFELHLDVTFNRVLPPAPTALSVEDVTSFSATVEWEHASESAQGLPVNHYHVEFHRVADDDGSGDSSSWMQTLTVHAPHDHGHLQPLLPGSAYRARVAASQRGSCTRAGWWRTPAVGRRGAAR